MKTESSTPWYRVPTMMIVAGVLSFTVIAGVAMLAVASNGHDKLIMSDQDYREWRDDMRATKALPDDD
ncbi:MAG: hypothetical protein AB8G17_03335 [Gammaproteobacteria bacterium]